MDTLRDLLRRCLKNCRNVWMDLTSEASLCLGQISCAPHWSLRSHIATRVDCRECVPFPQSLPLEYLPFLWRHYRALSCVSEVCSNNLFLHPSPVWSCLTLFFCLRFGRDLRQKYRAKVCTEAFSQSRDPYFRVDAREFSNIVHMEQKIFARRLGIHQRPSIALNKALCENLFMIFVSVLNKVRLFAPIMLLAKRVSSFVGGKMSVGHLISHVIHDSRSPYL